MAKCAALTTPGTQWDFCPSVPAAYAFAVLFALTTVAHVVQMFTHKKPYSWVIVVSGGMQTAVYIIRVMSIDNVTNSDYYSLWFVLMMVAPVWTNAYAYMVMGRMVYNFTPSASVYGVKAWRFGTIFVLLDLIAFLIQVGGAAMASGTGKTDDAIMSGIHIYMGGIGFQQLCIFLFLALAVRLHRDLRSQPPPPPPSSSPSHERANAFTLLYVEYAAVLLISVRIIFRLCEYARGFKSTIPLHEAYQYVLDSLLMLVALVLFNVWHPGRLMPGADANLPTRRQRKNWRRQGLEPRGRVGTGSLLPKYESVGGYSLESVAPVYEPVARGRADSQRGHYARVSTPSPPPDDRAQQSFSQTKGFDPID